MATRVLSLRVPAELAEWAEEYARGRGVTRQALCEEALQSFRVECERGVPEIRSAPARLARAREALSRAEVAGRAEIVAAAAARQSRLNAAKFGR